MRTRNELGSAPDKRVLTYTGWAHEKQWPISRSATTSNHLGNGAGSRLKMRKLELQRNG